MSSTSNKDPVLNECEYKIMHCLLYLSEENQLMFRCDNPVNVSSYGIFDLAAANSLHKSPDKYELSQFMRLWPKAKWENLQAMYREDWKLHSIGGPMASDREKKDGKIYSYAFEKCWIPGSR